MNKLFTDKTATAVFLRIAIEDALASVKPFIGTNKKAIENFMAQVIYQAQTFTFDASPYRGKSAITVKNGLSSYGIKTPSDLVDALVSAKPEMKMNKYLQLLYSRSKKIRRGNDNKNKSAIKKYTSDNGLDAQRTVAIRSQFGGFPVLFYPFNGAIGKDTAHQLNMLKLDYHYTTGCPYYQARPILLSSWQNLDEARQQASSVK